MQGNLQRKTFFSYRYQKEDIFFFVMQKKEVYDVRGNRTKETAQARIFFRGEKKRRKKEKFFVFWVNSKEVGRENGF